MKYLEITIVVVFVFGALAFSLLRLVRSIRGKASSCCTPDDITQSPSCSSCASCPGRSSCSSCP